MNECKYENKDEVLPHTKIDGRQATYGEILKIGLDSLATACEAFFDLDDEHGQAVAYMCDCALKYAQGMYLGKEPLLYACGEEPILGAKFEELCPND